jgi:hypothetical protein
MAPCTVLPWVQRVKSMMVVVPPCSAAMPTTLGPLVWSIAPPGP